MTLVLEISNCLAQMHTPFEIPNGVRINTHCLYPSNAMVQIVVMGRKSSFFVTDDGGAFKEAESAGADMKNQDSKYKDMLERQGLFMRNGVIFSPEVQIKDVPAALLLVANASKEIADLIFQHRKIARPRNFKAMVREMLKKEFKENRVSGDKIAGTSNKAHVFDNVVHFNDGSRLIVDSVLKDVNSINSRVVANLDIRAAKYKNITQRILYDDSEAWQSADLSLLDVSGVPIVAFSKSIPLLHQAMKLAA